MPAPRIVVDVAPFVVPGTRHRGIARFGEGVLEAMGAVPDPPEVVLLDPLRGTEHPVADLDALEPHPSPLFDAKTRVGWVLFQSRVSLTYLARTRAPAEVYLFLCADLAPWVFPPRAAVIVHDLISSCWGPWASRRRLGGLRDGVTALRMASAARLLTNSESTRRDALRVWGGAPDRAIAIPHVLPPMAEAPDLPSPRIREVREDPVPYAVFLGAREPRKGLGPLLERWEHAAPPDLRLVVAGPAVGFDRELEDRLTRLEARGDVAFLPDVSEGEKASLLAGARCLAFPSRYEGYGLPIAEAMLHGAPVVTFRNSSLEEACDGAGVLVEDGDYDAFLAAVLRLRDDEDAFEAARAASRARAARFDVAGVGARYLEVLRELTGR